MPADDFNRYGWRIPFLLSVLVLIAAYIIRREVEESPLFRREEEEGRLPSAPISQAFGNSAADIVRVICMALMNVIPVVATIFGAAYAVQPAYGVGFAKEVYLWIPVVGNIIAVAFIPFVGALSDRIGRRPPMIVGSLLAALLSFAYLHAISIHDVWMAVIMSFLMWGVVYQGYNAVFPSFFPELFRTPYRVSAMAIGQNIGTAISAFLPALFTAVAPPGSSDIPLTIGAITLAVAVIAALAALSARETYRLRLDDLGDPAAAPMAKDEYDRLRSLGATEGGADGKSPSLAG
jgi:MFS family permease